MVWRVATNRYMLRKHGLGDANEEGLLLPIMSFVQNNVNIWSKIIYIYGTE